MSTVPKSPVPVAKKRASEAHGKARSRGDETRGGAVTSPPASVEVAGELSAHLQRLIDDQAALIEHLKNSAAAQHAYLRNLSPLEVQRIGRQIGLWTALGKLTSSYRR